jgi:hypothetical protein
MENKSFYDQSGRSLTGIEIVHVDNTLLTPASSRCRRDHDEDGYILRKEPRKPVVIQDGVKFFPRFLSEMDTETSQWRYKVGVGVIETAPYAKLSIEERHQIRLQYQRLYAHEGGDMTKLNEDEAWRRLTTPEEYGKIGVHFSSMQEYSFVGNEASRSYAINHILTVGRGERARSLGKLSLGEGLGHWATNAQRSEMPAIEMGLAGMPAKEAAALDMSAQDFYTVTTSDLNDVVGILRMLDLVSPNDERRFDLGLR